MTARWRVDDRWQALAARQEHVLGVDQLAAWGWSSDDVRRPVDSGHWVRAATGVVATTTAPLTSRGLVWRAVLATGGAACGATALWLAESRPGADLIAGGGLGRGRDDDVHIAVDSSRRPRPAPGWTVHRHRQLDRIRRRSASPPRVTVEAAALEVCAQARSEEDAAAVVLGVVQRRLCTPAALRGALELWPTLRRRALVAEMLGELGEGITTPLELRYARDVERAHGLPVAVRNRDLGTWGAAMIVDVWYDEYGVIVELDGQVAHPRDLAFRDQARDNRAVLAGAVCLRFGWRDVAGRPCAVAAQVAAVLRARGWRGALSPCPGCLRAA